MLFGFKDGVFFNKKIHHFYLKTTDKFLLFFLIVDLEN